MVVLVLVVVVVVVVVLLLLLLLLLLFYRVFALVSYIGRLIDKVRMKGCVRTSTAT